MEKLDKVKDVQKHRNGSGFFLIIKRPLNKSRIHTASCKSLKLYDKDGFSPELNTEESEMKQKFFWCDTLEEAIDNCPEHSGFPRKAVCNKCKMPSNLEGLLQAAEKRQK